MKVNKRISVQGEWAKVKEDVKDGDIVVIQDAGRIVEGDYGERHVFKIETTNGDKNLSFNQTSMNALIGAYGDETDSWVGKKAKAWIIKQSVSGKLKDVLYLAAPDWELTEDGFIEPNGMNFDKEPSQE